MSWLLCPRTLFFRDVINQMLELLLRMELGIQEGVVLMNTISVVQFRSSYFLVFLIQLGTYIVRLGMLFSVMDAVLIYDLCGSICFVKHKLVFKRHLFVHKWVNHHLGFCDSLVCVRFPT